MCTFLYTVTSKNLLLKSLLFLLMLSTPEVKQIIILHSVVLAIGNEENSVAFYLKSETDSYYFNLARIALLKNIQIIMLLPSNVICCGEWQKHNYYYKYYLCEAGLSYYILLQQNKI